MKGSVQLLLITILATTATAKFDYDSNYAGRILEGIQAYEIHKAKVGNSDARVEWELINYNKAVLFQVKNKTNSIDGAECGGGPTIVIDNGQTHCLSKMIFKTVTVNGQEALKLGLKVQNSQNSSDWKLILSDLFKKREDEVPDLLVSQKTGSGVVDVEPITKEQVARVVFKNSFVGPASWVQNIVERGIYLAILKPEDREKTSKDLYLACPTIMDAETVDKVLELLLKKTQNEAAVESPQNDDRDEINNEISVKRLVNFWNKAEKK